jgi:predicted choloylglycine hydrolase
MALLKIMKAGHELAFDLLNKTENANRISVMVTDKAGAAVVLKISADRSILIREVNPAVKEGMNGELMVTEKTMKPGDQLIFNLRDKAASATDIFLMTMEKAGRSAVLKVTADRSIRIIHSRQHEMGDRYPQ